MASYEIEYLNRNDMYSMNNKIYYSYYIIIYSMN